MRITRNWSVSRMYGRWGLAFYHRHYPGCWLIYFSGCKLHWGWSPC